MNQSKNDNELIQIFDEVLKKEEESEKTSSYYKENLCFCNVKSVTSEAFCDIHDYFGDLETFEGNDHTLYILEPYDILKNEFNIRIYIVPTHEKRSHLLKRILIFTFGTDADAIGRTERWGKNRISFETHSLSEHERRELIEYQEKLKEKARDITFLW